MKDDIESEKLAYFTGNVKELVNILSLKVFLQELVQINQESGKERFLVDMKGIRCWVPTSNQYLFVQDDLFQMGFNSKIRLALLTDPEDNSYDFITSLCKHKGHHIQTFHTSKNALNWLSV